MKITCNRARLAEAFQIVLGVIPSRTTLPVLTNVKLTGIKSKGGDLIELAGTDLEIGVTMRVPVEDLKDEGTLVLAAQRVGGILRESTDEKVTIESDGNLAQIKCSDSTFKVVGVDPKDYPDLPDFALAKPISVEAKELCEMIRKTQFTTSSEIVRYALTGQLLEIRGKELRMVASDGKRLALMKRRLSAKAGEHVKDMKALVPPKALNLVERVLTREDETVGVALEESDIRIKTEQALIFSRIIEGSFPDYESVIPTDRDKKAVLEAEPFHSAVRRAVLMTTEKSKAVKLSFSKNKVVFFTRTPDVGEAKVELKIEYSGDDLDIAFNPDYFLDYLRVVGEEQVEFHLKNKEGAGLFKAGKDYLYVVMPLTVTV